jgi:ketosteroid isomerase-like protein
VSVYKQLYFVVLVALVGCASVSPELRIRELEQEQARLVVARDRVAIEKLFAPEFRIINPAGAIASRDELLKLLMDGTAPYKSAVYQTQSVQIFGYVVVTMGLETVVPNQGAQAGQEVKRRITHVWRREGRDWRLALRHATIVIAPNP